VGNEREEVLGLHGINKIDTFYKKGIPNHEGKRVVV